MKPEFDNSYAALPDRFYTRLMPRPVCAPETIRVNASLAARLGFDPEWLASDEGTEFAVGNHIIEGSDPIATVYAGHQFGNWVPKLGDGRAILLGEVMDRDGARFDVQLKGSGRTPYSRRGDGRSPLGPVLREYLISEAMAALGIPTSRALVAATTGERVMRDRPLPGAVLVRVARSHIRIGTFEYFDARHDTEALQTLTEHVLARHYPEIEGGTPIDLLRAVARRQAELVAQWQLVGFIHGVMNTDNMLLSGETIDYGPCAFVNAYDPATVFSSIDRAGRYAYGNQPPIAQWNLSRLADALIGATGATGAADADPGVIAEAQAVIDSFPQLFRDAYGRGMARKLGLTELRPDDWPLIEDLLGLMYESESDYTLTFVGLGELGEAFPLPAAFEPWLERWRARLAEDPASADERAEVMRAANPVFIPRNHLVEAALNDATQRGDFARFHELVDVLAQPFAYREELREFARPPRPEERVHATFCGT